MREGGSTNCFRGGVFIELLGAKRAKEKTHGSGACPLKSYDDVIIFN